MKNIAVILAGGVGSRLGADIPKQFLKVAGRMVIEHTIDAFDRHPLIDEVCVVVHPEWVSFMRDQAGRNNWRKVAKIVAGGSERYMSTLEALRAYADEPGDSRMLLHDAVRPLVSPSLIGDVCKALDSHRAAGAAVACTDTIWKVEDGKVVSIPDRKSLMRAQTPQGFRLEVIRKAYERAQLSEQIPATDDCGMVMRYAPEEEVYVVMGDESNIKVTYPRDMENLKIKS
ncbi:MAG: 2-C-methyl-D-erythritol 4-phosphate cytidylyltransferase [Bacteroidales bacterium]|nr:2-C-methyl-D-erythritol 4-phosphate cytidylyltransferase [Bacteroidales bacterium]